jgi:hypothetical protein
MDANFGIGHISAVRSVYAFGQSSGFQFSVLSLQVSALSFQLSRVVETRSDGQTALSLADILQQLQFLAQTTGTDGLSHPVAQSGTSGQKLENGCPGWDRTSDQVINSHLLCH